MTTSEDNRTLLLCGDVMLGRGIDQILAHPGDPTLLEPVVRDARGYITLAEKVSGAITRPADDTWPWGAALPEIARSRPAVLVVNLETSVTGRGDFAPGKEIHYRMSPDNLACLLAPGPDVCVLANNHVLDFGLRGLTDTLDHLHAAGLRTVGAGVDHLSAHRPAVVPAGAGPSVAVFSFAHRSSGVPRRWAASAHRPGVAVLPDLSDRTAAAVGAHLDEEKQRGSIIVVSLHWGSNWGYGIPREQVRFAHRLVEAGADVVHGHSSHHPRTLEVYDGRLVLYGCGDFINDYEGIRGYEAYRDDLRVLYRLRLAPTGAVVSVELLPFRSRRLSLEKAAPADVVWLASTLDRVSREYGVRVRRTSEDRIGLVWS